uniref:Uncharacterized protein n=1 Tax=Glossina austeni TaxID=7395 RepID=A0A1A9VLU7_GLOAU
MFALFSARNSNDDSRKCNSVLLNYRLTLIISDSITTAMRIKILGINGKCIPDELLNKEFMLNSVSIIKWWRIWIGNVKKALTRQNEALLGDLRMLKMLARRVIAVVGGFD